MDLPAELLVFIISLLSSRELFKVRYVSKTLRVFTEVPSLWRKFVWSYYRSCEEASVIKLLKVCGDHIRQLSFTNDHVLLPQQYCDLMLEYCSSVINLTLLTQVPLTKYELKKILNALKHLKTLKISWSETSYPAKALKQSSLIDLTLHLGKRVFPSIDDYESWIEDYISSGYTPRYVSIVQSKVNMQWFALRYLLMWWSNHSTRDQYRPPIGYTAHFSQYKVPFNLSPNLPQFHIQFSLTPLVKVNRFKFYDVLGQSHYSLKLNYCYCNDHSCNCVVINASVDENTISYFDAACYRPVDQHGMISIKDTFDVADFVVDVSVSDMNRLLTKDLEQLSFLIPNLQKLDLSQNDFSIDNMKGILAIATNCRNLKGLNLTNMHVESLDLTKFWEILSGMKLNQLSIEYCLITSTNIDMQHKMVNLYSTLQAMEIGFSICEVCESLSSKDLLSLSHFSSLQYCRLHHHDSCHSNVVHDIATSCKQLKCLIVQPNSFYQQPPFHPVGISLSSTCNNNLKQLFIDSEYTDVADEFMESVSAHGGLVHVVLQIATVTDKGVDILIHNSSQLEQLHICRCKQNGLSTLKNVLRKKYYHRRLFTTGYFKLMFKEPVNRFFFMYHLFNNKQNTVFFPLW